MWFPFDCRISQEQDDLNEILSEFENQTAENSRQIESMNTSSSHIYENKVESYKRDYTKLRKANRILINEIKDVLSLCYGNRKVKEFCSNSNEIVFNRWEWIIIKRNLIYFRSMNDCTI